MLPLQMEGPTSFKQQRIALVQKNYRIGQIVPSSNTTMETEIPAMLMARQSIRPERFTFHSSRMRMKTVKKEELAAMDSDPIAAPLSFPTRASTYSAMLAWLQLWRWALATTVNRKNA